MFLELTILPWSFPVRNLISTSLYFAKRLVCWNRYLQMDSRSMNTETRRMGARRKTRPLRRKTHSLSRSPAWIGRWKMRWGNHDGSSGHYRRRRRCPPDDGGSDDGGAADVAGSRLPG